MAKEFIGAVIGVLSRRIYAIVNPTDDTELDSPRLLLIKNEDKEPMIMVRVPRGEYMAQLSPDDVARLVASIET